MIQKGFPTFFAALRLSVLDSAKQYFVLLKTLVVLFVYTVRDAFLPVILLILLAERILVLPGRWNLYLEIAILLWFLFLMMKLDGALGYALTRISMGEKSSLRIGIYANKNGFAFFLNALRTGIFLFFGQMLLMCPCFLLLTNFVFSPYLFVFENVRGAEAKRRSREIAHSNPWLVFAQTTYLILIGYILLIFSAAVFLKSIGVVTIIIFSLLALFLALIQSNFIYRLYSNLIKVNVNESPSTETKFKLFVFVSVLVVVVIYLGFKFLPSLILKY